MRQYAIFLNMDDLSFYTPWGVDSDRASDALVVGTHTPVFVRLLTELVDHVAVKFYVDWGASPKDWFEEYNASKRPKSVLAGWSHSCTVVLVASNMTDSLRLTTDDGVLPELSNIDARSASYRNIAKLLDAIVRNAYTMRGTNPCFQVREIITSA